MRRLRSDRRRRFTLRSLAKHAFAVFARARVDADQVALVDEQRHAELRARLDGGRLGDVARGVAARARLGRGHAHLDEVRHRDADDLAVEELDLADHVVLQPAPLVGDRVLEHVDLLVVGLVHEDEVLALLIKEGHRLLFDVCGLELFARPDVVLDVSAGEQVLHLGAGEGGAFARLDELPLDDDVRLTVDQELGSRLQFGDVDGRHGRRDVAPSASGVNYLDTPSWCISEAESNSPVCSHSRPLASKRSTMIEVSVIFLPVAGMPMNGAWWVPSKRAVTEARSPSTMTVSITCFPSGNAP